MRSCQIEYVASDKDVGMVCGPQFNPPRLNSESRVASLSTDTEFRIISISAPRSGRAAPAEREVVFFPYPYYPVNAKRGVYGTRGFCSPTFRVNPGGAREASNSQLV
jgi:hypothetical protein